MIERILVEYLHDGRWTWSRDYPVTQEEEAKEYGRQLWRGGAAGVRISKFERRILVESRRSSDGSSGPRTSGPRPTPEAF